LIKVEPDEHFPQPAKLGNSENIQVGDGVMAAGNPFGLSHSVTVGIISAKGRVIGAGPYDDFLQTDAAINPGNSGGPLFDMNGEVIGVNTAMVEGGQGIGFAIPINAVRDLLPMLKEGEVVRGWLGVVIQQLTPELAAFFQLDEPKGVLVADLVKGGPAEKAGLQRGDIIMSLAGRPVDDPQEITSRVADINPGTQVQLQVLRDGRSRNQAVTIGTMPTEKIEEPPAVQPSRTDQQKWGVSLNPLTPALARRMGLAGDEHGVVIAEVNPMSPAARAGLKPGDVVQEVNGRQVRTVDQLQSALGRAGEGKELLVLVKRGENTFFAVLQG
jgi:serine protease Do